MSEHIRYAWGQSSLGDFLAATSERGIVAFEFGDDRAPLVEALRGRCPDANLVADADGLSDTLELLAALVDRPDRDPELPLDPRGTLYERRVWTALRRIPTGQTTSYGAVAAELGTRDAREVTEAIAANGIAILIPCHRVVKKDGSLSGYRWGVKRKRALLLREQKRVAAALG